MKSENKNFIYNVLYQLFNFIIPLITLPYISRRLGVSNIGTYSYTYSVVYYFMLLTLLGINNYGVREVSSLEKNAGKRSQKFSEIYFLQFSLGLIMLLIYNFLIVFIFKNYKEIFFIHNIFLISAILDINWLFFGLEKFKLTISRNVIIKIVSLILIFVLVKDSSDLATYTFIMSFSTLLSQLYLWLFRKKYVTFEKINIHNLVRVFRDCLVLFIPVLSYSIYRVMDKTMLGGISGTINLGLYDNAEKIINIPVSIVTALGTVMLPSMSKKNSDEIFFEKLYFSFRLCFFIIFPIAFGLLAISSDFSILFFGKAFEESGTIIKLLIPSFIFSSIASVVRTNYLIPKRMDNIYIISTIIGASINLIVNLILIPKFAYYGACIGTICAEFLVMFYQIIKTRQLIDFKKAFILNSRIIYSSLFCFGLTIVFGKMIENQLLRLTTQILVFVFVYLFLNKDFLLYEFFNIKKGGKCEKN